MLHRDDLVPLLPCLHKCHVEADFQFLGNHEISFCLACFTDTLNGFDTELLNRFTDTLQGMPCLTSGLLHLLNLGCGNIPRINTADRLSVQVDLQHDLGVRFPVLVEKLLDDHHHELHRCVVVIEHDDLVHLGRFGFLGAPLEHHGPAVVVLRARLGGDRGGGGCFACHENHSIERPFALQPQVELVAEPPHSSGWHVGHCSFCAACRRPRNDFEPAGTSITLVCE